MVFLMVFAISTTVTIKVKSELLNNNQTAVVAEASGETSLLSGVMNSIEKNPKLNVGGRINLTLEEEDIDISLNADINLKELTNPEVSGTVQIKHDDKQLDLFLTYAGGTIYISYSNVKIKATIADINSSVTAISSLFEELGINMSENSASALDGLSQSFANLNVDILLDALSNPKKTVFEEYDQYEISLPNICDVVLICDDKFNISAVSIKNFTLIDNCDVKAELFVAQDENIKIEEPQTENYFDIATAIDSVGNLFAEDYIRLNTWVSLYKDKKLAEHAKLAANLDLQHGNYAVEGTIKGAIDATIDAKYLQDELFVKFNDINVSAKRDTIAMLIELAKSSFDNINIELPKIDMQNLVHWIKNNYKNLLDNAVISDTKIKLNLDLSNFVDGLDELVILISFRDGKIDSISIDGLEYQNYMLRFTVYIDYPESITFNVNREEYFAVETACSLVQTIKNLEKFEISSNISATINQKDYNARLYALGDAQNHNYQASLSGLFGLDIDVAYLNSSMYEYPLYLRANDVYLSVPKNYLAGLVQNKVEEIISSIKLPGTEEIADKAKEILGKYWIGDVLKLSTIKLNKDTLEVSANLTALVHKTCVFNMSLKIAGDMLDIESFELEYDQTKVAGNFKFNTTNKEVKVANKTKYLDIKWLVNNLQSYLSSPDLLMTAKVDAQNGDGKLIDFAGSIGARLAEGKFEFVGAINNLLGKYNFADDVRAVYDGQRLYFEYGEQKFDASEQAIVDLLGEFGYDISDYIQQFKDAINYVSNLQLYETAQELINGFDLSSVNLSEISFNQEQLLSILDLLGGVKINASQICFAGEIAGANIDANIKLFSDHIVIDASVELDNLTLNANVNLSKEQANYDTSADSINLDPVLEVANKFANIVDAPAFEGTINLSFGAEEYQNLAIDYKLSVNLETKSVVGIMSTIYFGKEIKVRLDGTKLYVDLAGIHISCTLDELMTILHDDMVAPYVPEQVQNFDINNIDIDTLVQKVLNLLAETQLIYELSGDDNNLSINLLDKFDIVLSDITDSSLAAQFAMDGVSATITLAAREELELEEVDQTAYTSLTQIFDMAKRAYNYLSGKQYFARFATNISVNNNNIALDGYVGYNNGLTLEANTTFFGKTISIKIANKVVYIDIDGLKLKLGFAAAYEILAQAVDVFEINIDSRILDIAQTILTQEEFDFAALIADAKELLPASFDIAALVQDANIAFDNNLLSLALMGAEIAMQFDQENNLAGIVANFANDNFCIDAEIELCEEQQVDVSGEYADIADAKNILDTIKALTSNLQYNINVQIEVADYTFDVNAKLKIEDKRIYLQATACVYGQDILATFAYDANLEEYVLYLSAAGINIKATLDDIPTVIDWINETFDKDIQIDIDFIKELLDTLDFTMLLGRISFADISLSIAHNILTIGYKNISAVLEMANDVSGNIWVDGEQLCMLTLAQQDVQFAELQDAYLEFADVFEIVKNAYAYITGKEYYANIDLSFELTTTKDNQTNTTTINIENAYIGYDADGLTFDASIELFGKTLHATITNKVVYISFDGFKAKLSFADAYELLAEAIDVFGINLDENIMDLIEYVLTTDEIEFATLIQKAKALSNEPLDIAELIDGATISLSLEELALSVLGADITANFENSNLASIVLEYQKQTENKELSATATITLAQKQQVEVDGTFADLADAKNILATIKNFVDSKQMVGTININFDKIDVTGTYKVNFEDGLAMSLAFNVYGLDIVITLKDDTLYVQIEDIKVKAALADIDDILAWASETFGVEINLDTSFITSGNIDIAGLLDIIDFANLELSITNNKIDVALGEFAFDLTFGQGIDGTITYQKAAGEGEEQRKPLVITLDANVGTADIEVADHEYQSYTILTDLIDSIMQIVDSKRVSVTLPSFKVYDGTSVHYTASGSLQLDLSDENNKLFHAQVIVKDLKKDKTYDVRLSYRNNYWWIYFNNLKVKMHKDDVKELLAIICKVMDLDTTLIPGLAEVSASLDDINFESLSAILPDLSDFDPLSILGYIKSLTLENGQLVCDVDATLVTDNPDATDMRVIVDASGGRLSGIYGQNIYTGVTNAEHFDIELLVDASFGGVGSPASGNYIDLSGSNELIKALFNTAELDYFKVSGTISASLGSWDLVDIPLVLQVKVDEDRKPTIYAKLDLSVLTDSLISSAANGIVFQKNYKNDHIVEIYYKDDYVYFYSSGNSGWSLFSGTTYAAKMVKVHIDSLMEDPMYYLCFALSFSDTIQNEIDSSLESTAGHEPDLGKIIKSYTVKNSKDFSVVLDMEEISGNDKLSDTTINIGVINNSSTGGKNYLGTAGFDFQLSVGLTIHLSSDDLKLVKIGQAIDFTAIDNFINSYAYGEGKEMTSTNGGSSYSVSGGKQYSVAFDSNGGQSVATKTGYAGTTFALPTLPNKVIYGDGTQDVYAFAGWWEDSTLLKTPYTNGVIGHTNITVYAKWELIERYRTINFYLDGSKVSSVLALVGSDISYLGLQQSRIIEKGGYKYYQSFDKYTDANGNTVSVVGDTNQNVYINYVNTNVLKAYTLAYNTGVAAAIASISVYETEGYTLPQMDSTLEVYDAIEDVTKIYSFGGWFLDGEYTLVPNGIMPSANITLYAKWTLIREYATRLLTIYDSGAEVFSQRIEVGTAVDLSGSGIKLDANTQWYTTGAYTTQTTLPSTMPNANTTLHIRNRYSVTYTYYTISNHSTLNTNTTSQNLYQGEAFNYPAQTNDYIDYKNSSNVLDYRLYYTFNGYANSSENNTVMPNHDYSLTSQYSTQRKNYYTISFDMTLDYIPKSCAIGCSYVSTPSTPASLRVLEGTVIDLTQSKYQITVKIKATAIGLTKYTYKSTTWGTSKHADYSDGGNGVTSWTVSGDATLKPYWKKQ